MRRAPRSGLAPLALVAGALACTASPWSTDDLAGLCGTWRSIGRDGARTEERWSRHEGGLRGESHMVDRTGEIVATERMTLALAGGATVYHAEPDGSAPTDFREVADPAVAPAAGERVWIWENRAHDFPRRIVYRLGADQLTATISDPNGDDERRRGITWDYLRVAGCDD